MHLQISSTIVKIFTKHPKHPFSHLQTKSNIIRLHSDSDNKHNTVNTLTDQY